MTREESGRRLEELLAELEATQQRLEGSDDSEEAVELLATMAALAREVQAEVDRLRAEGSEDAPA